MFASAALLVVGLAALTVFGLPSSFEGREPKEQSREYARRVISDITSEAIEPEPVRDGLYPTDGSPGHSAPATHEEKLPQLPEGCVWVTHPEQDCPLNDPQQYAEWVKANDPVAIMDPASGIELVWVPGGRFMMGVTDDEMVLHGTDEDENRWYSNWRREMSAEQPAHWVILDSFWIGRTEVTVSQWETVAGSVPPEGNDRGEDFPVVNVGWEDCEAWSGRAGLLLPTEAQWEYAGRGPQRLWYPWGNEWDINLCQWGPDRSGNTTRAFPVGGWPDGTSWCGALDMAGNVSEWCRDWHNGDFYSTPAASSRNPVCSTPGDSYHVVRGGDWASNAFDCRLTKRHTSAGAGPKFRVTSVGFRVVLNALSG